MNKIFYKFFIAVLFLFLIHSMLYASPNQTKRIPEFENNKVSVWKTVIYPNKTQALKMHRHDHDRVIVALNDGVLKITNDKRKIHYLTLVKNKAYYLHQDIPNELHADENMSSHPITVVVVELK